LIDCQSGSTIGELYIVNLDPTNVTALVNPSTGWTGITTVNGPGVLTCGFQIPDAKMANWCPYVSATTYPGVACIKNSAGTVLQLSGGNGSGLTAPVIISTPTSDPQYYSTPTRNTNTIYLNSTGQTLLVSCIFQPTGTASVSNQYTVEAMSDASPNPTTILQKSICDDGVLKNVTVPVLPGNYYNMNASLSNGTLGPFAIVETQLPSFFGQAQYSPVRALNTIYHNTLSTALLVSVTSSANSGAGGTQRLQTDSSSSPTNPIALKSYNSTDPRSTTLLVLPGNYYEVLADTASTVNYWVETPIPITASRTTTTYSSSSRAMGTVYQNTGSTYLIVEVSMPSSTSSPGAVMIATSDANSSPSKQIAYDGTISTGLGVYLFFAVAPGEYYKVTYTPGSGYYLWNETQL
jgi:hypothetical protein